MARPLFTPNLAIRHNSIFCQSSINSKSPTAKNLREMIFSATTNPIFTPQIHEFPAPRRFAQKNTLVFIIKNSVVQHRARIALRGEPVAHHQRHAKILGV